MSRELDIAAEPSLYSGAELQTISGLETINKGALYATLARILDGSRFFEFKVRKKSTSEFY